jgi:hypothetical protein
MLGICSGIKFEPIPVIVGPGAGVVDVALITISIVTAVPSPETTIEPPPLAIMPVSAGGEGAGVVPGFWVAINAFSLDAEAREGEGSIVALMTVAVFGMASSTSSQIL